MGAETVFVGLGSNLDDPVRQVRAGLAALAALEQTELAGCSQLYRSAPMGPPGQPDYINAVARLHTRLAPETLLDALQAIEARAGRDRSGERWGPRTLDLDILLYTDRRIDSARLQVPHPGIAARNFVLYPLAELAPDLDIPGLGPLPALLTRCPPEGLERLVGGSK
ncbi:MAG: 2-amino-4-hydroxy-6-hydroxymethyldihydropteridine diphosphokinase [Gammaproteobacteria bacterium]|nr:2-amino-4-hydroxy-6-hydroxymethyldihydropteridine diphosphokinase [Gammaproteobacteria bacterium]